MKILKSIAVSLGGVFFAVLVVALVQQLGHTLFETAPGLEDATPEKQIELIKEWLPTAPFGAIAMVLVSWVSGTFFGSWFAARFTEELPYAHAAPTICVMVLCALLMLLGLPHPPWMNIASLLILPAGYWGARMGGGPSGRDQSASSEESDTLGSDGGGSNMGAEDGE